MELQDIITAAAEKMVEEHIQSNRGEVLRQIGHLMAQEVNRIMSTKKDEIKNIVEEKLGTVKLKAKLSFYIELENDEGSSIIGSSNRL